MANPDQKTVLMEQALKDIKEICEEYQKDSGSSNSEVKSLLKKIASFWDTEETDKFGFR